MGRRSTLRSASGYAPLAILCVVFVLMAWLVPSVNTAGERDVADIAAGERAVDGAVEGAGDGAVDVESREELREAREEERAQARERTRRREVVRTLPGRGRGSCEGKDRQVAGDPYRLPCIEFEGDNGGATSRGVTAEKILVSFRITGERGFLQTLAALAGAEIQDRPADIKRTVKAFEKFFNDRYQLYGRQIEVIFYDGAGSETAELLGGGQAEAEADAELVAKEIGAFAELNGSTAPFADALYRRKVIAFGTPYLSREWHIKRAPYNWSVATDCSIVAEVAAELANKQLAGKPARWAAGDLKDKPRKFAGLSPENPWYQECHDAAIRVIRDAGNDPGLKINYKLDINTFSNQAANVIAKLKSEGATTIFCGCDPIFPVFLSAKAAEQDYQPEWIVLGTALTDWDVSGQLYEQDTWSHAFGVSSLGEAAPIRAGLGYAAYKTVRDDEPAFAAEVIYAQMYMLVTGVHMGGPNLTPFTFEKGMFSYPGGSGPYGTWGFDQRSYTPTRDYRVIWWDPDRVSIVNKEEGAYVTAFGGRRFRPGEFPRGDPPVFRE